MSGKIDNRVVSMKFDNASFASKAQATLNVLEKLKKSLDFKSAGKGFASGLDSAASTRGLSSIASAVDGIKNKFSAMGVVGIAVLANLANKAVAVGGQMLKAMTIEKPLAGLKEYELNIKSVGTILNNTKWAGTNIKDVNKALAELNKYADQTVYSFSDMTYNIGQFTAAGVKLKPAVASIKGLANLAAMSGSSAQQASTAMYQLSQAIASGTVRLMDWNSVQSAGMGGKVFQDLLVNVAKKHGIAVDSMIKKEGSFRESLKEGWLSAGVMTEALSLMTGDLSKAQIKAMGYSEKMAQKLYDQGIAAKQAATMMRTMSQVMDSTNEAIESGWAETWQTILGDYSQATKLFTRLGDMIGKAVNDQSAARNKMLKEWASAGGRTALFDGLFNILEGIGSLFETIGKAWRDVFPPTTGKQLADITKAFRDWTKNFKMSSEQLGAVREVARSFFGVLKVGGGVVQWFASGFILVITVIGKLLTILWNLSAPLRNFVAGLVGTVDASQDFATFVANLIQKLIALREAAIQPLLGWLDRLAQATSGFSNIGKDAETATGKVQGLGNAGAFAVGIWDNVVKYVSQAWDAIKRIGASIGDFIVDIVSGVPGSFSKIGQVLSDVGASFAEFFRSVSGGLDKAFKAGALNQILAILQTGVILGFFLKFKKALADVGSVRKSFIDTIESLGGAFNQLTSTLKTMQNDLRANILMKIAAAVAMLAGAMWILSTVNPERMQSAAIGLGIAMATLLAGIAVISKIAGSAGIIKMPFVAVALTLLAGALLLIATAVKQFGSMDWDTLQRGLVGVGVAIAALMVPVMVMSKFQGKMVATSTALVVLAAAVLLMAVATEKFGTMDTAVLIQGGIALGSLLVVLMGFMMLDPAKMSTTALTLMALSASVLALSGAVAIFGLMPIPVLVQGGIAIVTLLGALAGAAALAQKSSGGAAAIAALAASVTLLIVPIAYLGNMDLGALAQGMIAIGIALAGMVFAANAMKGAAPGVASIIGISLALGILAGTIAFVGSMDIGKVAQGLIVLAGSILLFAGLAAILAPVAPAMYALAGAIAVVGLGVALIGGGLVMFSIGLAALGPAAALGAGGLKLLAAVCIELAPHAITVAAVAAAFGILGAAVLLLGSGVVVLGAGVTLLSVGLTMLAAAGIPGANALIQVVEAIKPLIWDVATITIIGAAFAALGAGLIVAGAGAITFATGGALMLAVLTPLMLVMGNVEPQIQKMVGAFNTLSGLSGGMASFTSNLISLASALDKVMASSNGFASSVEKISGSLKSMAATVKDASTEVQAFPKAVTQATKGVSSGFKSMESSTKGSVTNVSATLKSLTKDLNTVATDIPKSTAKIVKAFTDLGSKSVTALNTAKSKINSTLSSMKSSVGSQATAVGNAIIDGMVRGMSNSGKVEAAARSVALKALRAAKDALDSHSPSREFEKLGKYANEGFAKGLIGNQDQVEKAFAAMRATIKSSISEANKDIKSLSAKLKKLEKDKHKSAADKKAIAATKAELSLAKKLAKNAAAADKLLASGFSTQKKALAAKQEELDAVNERLKEATDNLKEAQKVRDDAANSYRDQYNKLPELGEDGNINDFIANIQAQIAATEKFNKDLTALRAQGLNDKMFKEILAKGLDAQPFLDQIKDAGWGGITNLNALADQLDSEATKLGVMAGGALYQAGVDSAQGIVDGIQSEADAITGAMEEIAASIVDAIKKKLGIKSPSRVLAEVGVNAIKGVGVGFKKETTPLLKKTEEVGKKLTDGFKKGLDFDISPSLDLDPVVRPVLDLTEFEKGLNKMRDMVPTDIVDTPAYRGAVAVARQESAQAPKDETPSINKTVNFTQNNNSPKALSEATIYRQTKNQISRIKEEIDA